MDMLRTLANWRVIAVLVAVGFAAMQLEQLEVEQELARLDDADDRVTGDAPRTAARADVRVRHG